MAKVFVYRLVDAVFPHLPVGSCPTRCKLGRCATKGSNYSGGNEAVFQKLKNGICPICGGATEQKYFRK